MRIVEADAEAAKRVLERSFDPWGEGARLEDYIAGNLRQLRSAWAREHYRFLVALDEDGALLASLKWFTFPAEIDGRPARLTGLGAIYTPPERRRRGHAAALIEATLERARDRGDDAALLMSEIGGEYYARLGFRALPAEEESCLPYLPAPWPAAPSWVSEGETEARRRIEGLRPMVPEDIPALAALHDRPAGTERFRLRRDPSGWEQALLKIEAGLRMWPDRPHRLWVVERAGTPVAYAVLRDIRGALQWREHGAAPGHEERLADLFWIALAEARARGVNRLDAWRLPEIVAALRLYPVARRPQRSVVIMLRGLQSDRPLPAFASAEECRISWLDLF